MNNHISLALVLFVLLFLLGASLLALPVSAMPPMAPANTQLYVAPTGSDSPNTCTSQSSPCLTIGYAITQAPAGTAAVSTTITIASGTYIEALQIGRYVILQGPTGGSAAVISGNNLNPVIVVTKTQVSINNLTIENGNAGTGNGGGIQISGSGTPTVFIRNSIITGNSAAAGGGIYNANGAVFIVRSLVANNTATSGDGGGLLNAAGAQASISTGAIVTNTANAATPGNGGGVANAGTFTVTNSTIGANNALNGSGGGVQNSGTLSLNNATISGNSASSGAGVNNTGTVNVKNSILALNTGADCVGTFTSGGYNLRGSSNPSCTFNNPVGEVVSATPALSTTLALNGGFTPNYTPLSGTGTPIDAGNPAGCTDANGTLLTTDQRGSVRPQGAACDIGSVETGNAPSLGNLNPSQATAGSPTFTMTATGSNFKAGAKVLWVVGGVTTTLTPSSPTATVLTVTVTNTLVAAPGIASVYVENTQDAAPNMSSPLPFTINASPHTVYLPFISR